MTEIRFQEKNLGAAAAIHPHHPFLVLFNDWIVLKNITGESTTRLSEINEEILQKSNSFLPLFITPAVRFSIYA